MPVVYNDLSTPRVLVMEFCEGGKVNDRSYIKKNRIPVNEVRANGGAWHFSRFHLYMCRFHVNSASFIVK